MKRIVLCIVLFICIGHMVLHSATDTRNGLYIPSKGNFRVFVVFAELTNDPSYGQVVPGWNAGEMPSNPNVIVDNQVSQTYQTDLSKYFQEISFDNLKITGDYYPQLIQIPYISYVDTYNASYYDMQNVFQALKNITNGQQIQTPNGFQFPNDFDLWTLNGNQGYVKSQTPDGYIDCIVVSWRANSHIAASRGGSGNMWNASVYPPAIANKSGITMFGQVYADDMSIFWHELSHNIVGDNTFHSGGANSNNARIYMQDYSGYSILSGWNRINKSYNGWDRYHLGWKSAQKTYDISANNTSGQELASDLVYGQAFTSGDSGVYVLKNFASSGDAVRIKLPYIKSENTSAKEQWIWIENHQLLPGTIEYDEGKYGANKQMNKVPRGIYMNVQVGNNDFSTYLNSGPNYISPINSFGNYDFTYSGDVASMSNQTANPFTGVGFASYHPVDLNGDDKIICKSEQKCFLTFNFNGVNMSQSNWAAPGYSICYYLGSVFDAFYQGSKISMTTNPAPVSRLTYKSDVGSANSTPQSFDNRKVYLNGICVRVLEQMANGDMKISVRWNDFKIKNNVRWCGDIVLNEKIDVQSNATVLLDQGLTPVRPTNPILFNGTKIFASPTTFNCKSGSEIKVESGGSIVLKNNSSIIAQSGSTTTVYSNANIVVESGSTLQLKSGASLNVQGSGKIIVKPGAYICVESGATINLQDYNSLIVLEEGAIYGANPLLFTSPSCAISIIKTGNGSIADFNQDVYIQNQTIGSSRYIGGRHIYVGNHVDSNQTFGDVKINSGANIIFDCKDVTFDSGFECAVGGTYEVKNH